jgi:exosortase
VRDLDTTPVRRPIRPSRSSALAGLGIGGLLVLVFAPALAWLLTAWQVHPYYSHGILMPAVAAWFAWRARRDLTTDPPAPAGLAVVAAGLALHLTAAPWAAHPLSVAALLVVLLGLCLLLGGRRAGRAAALPLALLALAIPLPGVERLAPPLAAGVARLAADAAGSMGVVVVQAGAQLSVADGAFVVGAPCSGLRSLVALTTVAVVVAGQAVGPLSRRLALVALALPLALTANWLRLTGLLWLADRFGTEAGLRVFHGPASPAVFLAAAGALLVAGQALGCNVRTDS